MDISILPQFGGIIWTLLAFVTALSIIVAIHEYGHYIVGRWCGIHAEVFSIGFGPVLWSRPDKRGTVWQIAAVPLGGYVKFLGDANAASVGEDGTVQEMTQAERERTMPGAKLWKRAATVAAGPIFNFILSILVFAGFVLLGGQADEDPVVGELKPLPAEMVTLEAGDRILAIEGAEIATLADIFQAGRDLTPASTVSYTVERAGQTQTIEAAFPLMAVVGSIQPRSAAMDVGIEVGDVIRKIDGEDIYAFEQLRTAVMASDGKPLLLDVWRAGESLEIALAPRRVDLPMPDGGFETRWLIGITGGLFFEPETVSPGVWSSLGYGATQTYTIVKTSLSALWHIASGQISTCNLSGPIGIAETSGATASQGLTQFIWFIAMLSTAVGLLNLFPIPVLDGGHLVFHAYEAVSGKPPSDTAMRRMMIVGLALMGTLMIFALSNDLFCP